LISIEAGTDDAHAARRHVATTPTASVAPGTPFARDAAADTRIFGTIHIDTRLEPDAPPGTTLFVYAMDPAAPGPPLAVLRLKVERWPVSFVVVDADAMIPGRNLSAARSIQLEARVSPSGDALPRPGDLVGRLPGVDPRTQQPVNISINHQIT
jgi:cytochrome c-type biogenesis protein CcmH